MLTQRPAPYPKCELNIISFLTLLHPLHCPICFKNIIVTLLLLQVIGGWEGCEVVHLCFCLFGWTEGGYYIIIVITIIIIIIIICTVGNCSFMAATC